MSAPSNSDTNPGLDRGNAARRLGLFPLLLAAALLACGGSESAMEETDFTGNGSFARESDAPSLSKSVPRAEAPAMDAVSGLVMSNQSESSNPDAALNTPASQTDSATVQRMIIRNGSASVEVDSLEPAIAALQQMATRLGGYVGNSSLASGEYQVRSATLELRIPSAAFEGALQSLSPLGTVENVSSTAQDVGEEFVDLTARATNARRLEDRLVTLLATRTGKLEEVLSVERELSRVRETIERYEGRLRYLRAQVSISTLTVTVHERAPLVNPNPGQNVIAVAFRDAWKNLVGFVAGFIALLGIIVPTALLLGGVAYAWRVWRTRG